MDYKEEHERREIGKRIVLKINDAIDGELVEDIFPALCWILGAIGSEAAIGKDEFMSVTHRAVGGSYDVHMTEDDDATTH